jgi:LuxR family transcriptional regulator, maltose regulon positive regulatory protein
MVVRRSNSLSGDGHVWLGLQWQQRTVSSYVLDQAQHNLVATKLYRPAVGGDFVRRPRLTRLLDQGSYLPLTLISAPAGSGKTSLLSDWLAACPCPSAWLSLDETDGDLSLFLSYLIAALRTICPGACPQTLAILQAPELPPVAVLAGVLSNEIESLHDHPALAADKGFVLALDDYHLLSGQAVNSLLAELLRHPPRPMHLALATRSDPALPLTSLRARSQVVEIRRQDLRFTLDEVREYIQQALQQAIDEDIVAVLHDKTEGWVTGLVLAILSSRHAPDSDEVLSDLAANERFAMDYLMDEVLSRQPQAIQDFLLKTSLLDRMYGPLCEAVTGLSDPLHTGQAHLEWLERANLFVVALDTQGRWFRYHHLFQQLLRNRLLRQAGPAEVVELRRRASAWLAGNGFVEDAITQALAAGDEAAAVQIIEANRHQAMNQERWQQLEAWLRLLPRRLVDERPELALAEAWIQYKQWRFGEIAPYLARIENLLPTVVLPEAERVHLQGEVDVLRSAVSYYSLEAQRTFDLAGHALQTLPMACSIARGLAWMYYAAALQLLGDSDGARAAIHEGLQEDRVHGNSFPGRLLIGLGLLNWMAGDLADLNRSAAQLLRTAGERQLAESAGWAHYLLGCAAYQWNDLAGAEEHFAAVVEQRYVAHSAPFSHSCFGLAAVLRAQGKDDQAQALAESALAFALEINNPRVLADARAFQAWLALQQGRPADAQRWAESVDARARLLPFATFFVPAITLAQVLLEQGTPASLRQASELLERLHGAVASQHNRRFAVDVLALQAWLDDLRGDEPAALAALQQAVALAQPGGIVRAFADLGPQMAGLLTRLRQQGYAVDFIGRLLRAFPAGQVDKFDLPRYAPQPARPADLIEPLTYREQEILELLSQRLSAKEIAERLVISDRTVKRHTANIYQKLGAHGRQQAVAAGRTLGLLSSA